MELIQHQLSEKHNLKRATRTLAWIRKLINYSRANEKVKRKKGLLSTNESGFQLMEMIKIYQNKRKGETQFKQAERTTIKFLKNENGISEYHGRITGDYPIFIPKATLLAEKLVEEPHYQTLHRGVTLTMAKTGARFWIPHLRQLAKTVIRRCNSCKRFQAIKYFAPVPGQLLTDRTNSYRAFQVVGLNYAGPIFYKGKNKNLKKSYILLITCSLSRAVHLELVQRQKLEELIICFKRFVARRGRPQKLYSDNAKTFKGATD